jgi:hypothetical protein
MGRFVSRGYSKVPKLINHVSARSIIQSLAARPSPTRASRGPLEGGLARASSTRGGPRQTRASEALANEGLQRASRVPRKGLVDQRPQDFFAQKCYRLLQMLHESAIICSVQCSHAKSCEHGEQG